MEIEGFKEQIEEAFFGHLGRKGKRGGSVAKGGSSPNAMDRTSQKVIKPTMNSKNPSDVAKSMLGRPGFKGARSNKVSFSGPSMENRNYLRTFGFRGSEGRNTLVHTTTGVKAIFTKTSGGHDIEFKR